jgi:hypothetical protein
MQLHHRLLTLACSILLPLLLQAQNYNTAVGIKVGTSNGLTIKHFMRDNKAIEGIVASRWNGIHLTGLYEVHAPAFNTSGFNWYYGAGGHIGFWEGHRDHPWFEDNSNHTVVGIDGVLGLEYTLLEAPFTFAIDWKPAFNIIGYSGLWVGDGGLAIRYYW